MQKINFNQEPITQGSRIMLVPPHPKVAETFSLGDVDAWIDSTVEKIQQHTDRPVFVRSRPENRSQRQFSDALRDNVHAVVVYNSNAGVESVVHHIPVVALGQCGSTPVSQSIEAIDKLKPVDQDQRWNWLKHLSYCQFTQAEMRDGTAWRILHE